MPRSTGTLMAVLLSLVLPATSAFSAEPERGRVVWGTVTKATADSVAVAPESARGPGGDQKPAEQTFALAKDKTEFAFAEIEMTRRSIRGDVIRAFTDRQPATAADLRAGQLVRIAAGDGEAAPASLIIMVWSVAGTIVKVDGESITFRPAPEDAPAAKAPPKQEGAPAAADSDKQFTIGKDATRVRFAEVTNERPAPSGHGIVKTISYRDGTLADLKADQSVVVCVRNGTAAKITIHIDAAERKAAK